jgi:plastocyanin
MKGSRPTPTRLIEGETMPLRLALVLGLSAAVMGLHRPRDSDPGRTHSVETGMIVGTVEISRALASRRPQFRIYADPGNAAASPRDELAAEMRNVVIYLDSGLAPGARRADSVAVAVMSQAQERFDPHVVAIPQGGRVDFPNRDNVYHNVFSLSSARTFDLGRYRSGSTKSVTFGKRGIVPVFCHIHADMSGIVLVLPNPFFTSPASTGRYEIPGVPAGEYTIVGWHERTRPVTRRVRVVAGHTTTIDFSLPLSSDGDR